jgi:threonine dehydrogenase-like Zn-dependent dehydrogenase
MNQAYPMAVVNRPGKEEFEDRPAPRVSANQVLIKTRTVSICGSDLHTFTGRPIMTRFARIDIFQLTFPGLQTNSY